MSPPEVWGPPTWRLFHILTETIKDEYYETIRDELFNFIKRICSFLPCPDCSMHASKFMQSILPQNIATKSDLKNMLYVFHNIVNKRKNKQVYNYEDLAIYQRFPLSLAINQFIKIYNTKGNMNLLTESFQRQMILRDFKQWITARSYCFNQ